MLLTPREQSLDLALLAAPLLTYPSTFCNTAFAKCQDGTMPLELWPSLLSTAEGTAPWQQRHGPAAGGLAAYFASMRLEGRGLDVTVACGDRKYRAHSAVLASKSEYWARQFVEPWSRRALSRLHLFRSPRGLIVVVAPMLLLSPSVRRRCAGRLRSTRSILKPSFRMRSAS